MSKIFFVDNDVYLTRLYERAFRLAKHEIEIAQDPVAALRRLKNIEELPDVIIMDVHMPNMTGTELFEQIHTGVHTKNIPVVVMTNSIKKTEAQRFVDLGATVYLMKMDHDPAEIVKKVEEIINQRSNAK